MMRKAISGMPGLLPLAAWRLMMAVIVCLALMPGLRSATANAPVPAASVITDTGAASGTVRVSPLKGAVRQVLLTVSHMLDVVHDAALHLLNAVYDSLHALITALEPENA